MSRSSIAMGDSWVLCKSAVLTANSHHECDGQLWVGHTRKNVLPVPISTKEPSSRSLVSLRAAMSILYLASSQAMSAVRSRAPNPVEYAHSNLRPQVAFVLLKNLSCTFFNHVWDNPVAAVGHPGKVEQAMFGPSFLGPSSTEGEQLRS